MSSDGIASVDTYNIALKDLLKRARHVKPGSGIEPALSASDFDGGIEAIGKLSEKSFIANNQAHYAAIETACRNIFYDLLVSLFLGLLSEHCVNSSRLLLRLMNLALVKYGIYLMSSQFYQI